MPDNAKPPVAAGEGTMKAKIDYDEIRKLVALLEERNLALFELEVDGLKIKISRNVAAPAPVFPAVAASTQASAESGMPSAPAAGAAPEPDKDSRFVTSPMVGTFYRAPAPSADPFVEIGDVVKKGQTLCIIEAMKLMNEIESDADGVVTAIHVENGKPVEYGQRLFSIQVVP
jgi:acetyl-CoA carboxylase biotin carboxyl carrier protein